MSGDNNTPLSAYRAKYAYVAGFRRRDWAWEFLRRNQDYQRAAYLTLGSSVSIRPCPNVFTLMKMRAPQPEANEWGLMFFANPDLTALTARHFWTEEADPDFVSLQITRREQGERDELFDYTVARCAVDHLVDAEGAEHLLLRGKTCTAQCQCTGLSLLDLQLMKMTIGMKSLDGASDSFEAYQRAEQVFNLPVDDPETLSGRQERLRNALICLDMKEAGFDLRQAAIVIYGEARIEQDWVNTRAMRDRVRGYYRTVVRLRDGGYRMLLKAD